MKRKPTDIINSLYKNLKIPIGRHLYAVMGSYSTLEAFTKDTLGQAKLADGSAFPTPISVNKLLLNSFEDDSLDEIIVKELKRPKYTQSVLDKILEGFLREQFAQTNFIILEHLELVFAYSLDLSKLRRWAANQNHILVLLPGENRNQQIYLFVDSITGESINFDNQLFSENNIWELDND
jgi:hypothetical protein